MRPQSKSPDEELYLPATIPVADLGAARHPQDLVAQPRSKSTGEGEAEPGHRVMRPVHSVQLDFTN